jgi:hypothetical protein
MTSPVTDVASNSMRRRKKGDAPTTNARVETCVKFPKRVRVGQVSDGPTDQKSICVRKNFCYERPLFTVFVNGFNVDGNAVPLLRLGVAFVDGAAVVDD